MKKRALSLVGALAGLALLIAGWSDRVQLVEAADHADGIDAMSTTASDITDHYSWVWDDNGTPSLAMIINVTAPSFPDNIQYAWTLVRDPLPGASATAAQMICQFNSTAGDDVSCFFGGANDFVEATGDPSGSGFEQNGIRVFAGQRDDPFFFNGDGFTNTAVAVRATNLGDLGVTVDANGCPNLAEGDTVGDFANVGAAIASCLTTACDNGFGSDPSPDDPTDAFTGTVASIVVSIPISMLPADADSDVLAISASTHVAP